MKRTLVLIGTFLLLTSWASAAVEQGDVDVDFSLRWSSESGDKSEVTNTSLPDRDVFEIGLGVAKEVTRRIQLGISAGYEDRSSGPVDDTVKFIDLKLRYHILPDAQFVPYVGGIYRWYDREYDIAGYKSPDFNGTGSALGFLAGLRYELTEHNDIYLEYQNLSYDSDWPLGFSDGSKILMGLIHQIR